MIKQDYWQSYRLELMGQVLEGNRTWDGFTMYTNYTLSLDEMHHVYAMIAEFIRGLELSGHKLWDWLQDYSAISTLKYWSGEKPVHPSRLKVFPRSCYYDTDIYCTSVVLHEDGLHFLGKGYGEISDRHEPFKFEPDDESTELIKIGSLREVKMFIRNRRKDVAKGAIPCR